MLNIDISNFITAHKLPKSYQQVAERWFFGLADAIKKHQHGANKPLLIGINGAQGAGKSTLADLLVFIFNTHFKLSAIALSIDDFYLTRAEREGLAETVHPLLMTRGAPGTHDIALAQDTITQLLSQVSPVEIPRFNKATDDRYAESEIVSQPLDIILLEGWCVGSAAQPEDALFEAVNDLEANEDQHMVWRRYVNAQLATDYQALFKRVDCWVMLKAPSFNCVFNWRLEQEQKLRAGAGDQQHVMSAEQVKRFIQFYQRITESTLATLPAQTHYLYTLNENREITNMASKQLEEKQWLVFTDMDGSLLDHYSYTFDPAIPTLDALKQQAIPVIPITSKTQAELELLRVSLDINHPFVVENGAAIFIPKGYFSSQPADTIAVDDYWVKEFVEPRAHWHALLNVVGPQYENCFITFAEAGVKGIMEMTGLDVASATRASKRQYGEPLSWRGSASLKQQFISELKSLRAQVLEGGRFMHISGLSDKGIALKWLADVYQTYDKDKHVSTIALGDSNNDQAMLEVADTAVLIRSPVHDLPEIKRTKDLFVSTDTGPQGWAEGVNHFIDLSI